MTDSLRDQMLKLGFKKTEPPTRPPAPPPRPAGKPSGTPARAGASSAPKGAQPKPQVTRHNHQGKPTGPLQPRPANPARSQEEIDLARAYALRDRQDREERERSKRETEAKARERREKREQLRALLQGKSLNDPEADQMRHFPHAGKIKRVHVNGEQLNRLNAGELGVVQSDGHYVLVDRDTALTVRVLYAEALLLLPEPGDGGDDDWNLPVPAAEPAST